MTDAPGRSWPRLLLRLSLTVALCAAAVALDAPSTVWATIIVLIVPFWTTFANSVDFLGAGPVIAVAATEIVVVTLLGLVWARRRAAK